MKEITKLQITEGDLPIKQFEKIRNVSIEKCMQLNSDFFLINGCNKPIYSIFRYSPFEYLYKSFENNTLFFSSPELWDDPFEKQLWNIVAKHLDKSIYCISYNINKNENEEAGWSLYTSRSSITPLVRYSVTIESLFALLYDYKERNSQAELYIGLCDYSKDRQFFEGLMKYLKKNASKLNLIKIISLMLLKRKSYKFENEIRLFLILPKINQDHYIIKLKNYGHQLKDIVGSVTLPPLPTGAKLSNTDYTRLQKILNEGMMTYLKDKLGNHKNKVVNSGLYRLY